MDIHYNARTCPRSRELIIQRVKEQGQSVQEVAQSLGISERTVYKWLARYQAQGRAGLEDRSSRPARIAGRLRGGFERQSTVFAVVEWWQPRLPLVWVWPVPPWPGSSNKPDGDV